MWGVIGIGILRGLWGRAQGEGAWPSCGMHCSNTLDGIVAREGSGRRSSAICDKRVKLYAGPIMPFVSYSLLKNHYRYGGRALDQRINQ